MPPEQGSKRRTAVSAVIVMACTLFSRILGFVRTAAIGAFFGAGGIADVINLVFNIPNNLRKLLAEGALSAAFIPELSSEVVGDPSGSRARYLTQNILALLFLTILPLLAACLLFPAQILGIFEQFADPAKKELSVVLFRWMMPYLFFVSVSALMMAVHNTHERFFVPAITPIVFSLSVIGFLFAGRYFYPEHFGAFFIGAGVLAGGVAQILVQMPSFHRLGYKLRPRIDFHNPAFRRVMYRWAPMLVTSSLFALNNQIAMLLASFLPDKSTSALAYAVVFYQLPFGIFSASITTVLYPRMTRLAAENNRGELLESLLFGYRNLWALLLPSAMALILLGEPIVAIAFQRGAFSAEDTRLTARVLTAYAAGMPFVGIFNITQRAFYALGDVRRPFKVAMFTVLLDIGLSLIFVFVLDYGAASLAWSNSISFTVGASVQLAVLRRRERFPSFKNTLMSALKALLGTGAGAAVILVSLRISGSAWWQSGSSFRAFMLLLLIAVAAATTILLVYGWLQVEAVSIILKRKKRK